LSSLLPLAIDWQQILCDGDRILLISNPGRCGSDQLKTDAGVFDHFPDGLFLLLGLLAGVVNGNQLNTESAYSAAMFYALTYG
jgi:NADH-quinone oxidoreductase subunit N